MTRSSVRLPDGETIPALGQGTYRMGAPADRNAEIAALRLGFDLGMTLVDTAEMYGDGAAETLVGEAMKGRRDDIFVVTKVCPQNTGRDRMTPHCEASLKRLNTDRIDLYLVHWRGGPALGEQVDSFESLKARGLIRRWGVSNFDTADMQALVAAGGEGCATNQIYHNLEVRGPEFDLMPWMSARSMPAMAYSPVGQGELLRSEPLARIAADAGMSPAQLALAWLLHRPQVAPIPKAATADHVRANAAAADLPLAPDILAACETAFPSPTHKTPLQLI